MEHDMLTAFTSTENLFFLDHSFFAGAPSAFSPREFHTTCSPRGFLATYAPTLAHLPDPVEWDSTGSVGSRRSSDEFSEASARAQADWRKPVQDATIMKSMPIPPLPPAPVKHEEGTKFFMCKEPGCRKIYTTTEGLRLHNRNIHMNDKRHKCLVEGCDRAFVRASDLKLHVLRIHETERPFPCPEKDCNKSFACNSELTRHLNCHNRSRSARKKQRRSASDDDDDEDSE